MKDLSLENLTKIINESEDYCNRKSLTDEYLEENNQRTRKECWYGDFSYGIVYIAEDYVLPFLKELQKTRQAEKGEIITKCCKYCGLPEDITENRSNWTMHKSCSKALRQKRYRIIRAIKNKKKTLQQGSSQLGISVVEMKRLLNKEVVE